MGGRGAGITKWAGHQEDGVVMCVLDRGVLLDNNDGGRLSF